MTRKQAERVFRFRILSGFYKPNKESKLNAYEFIEQEIAKLMEK